MGLVASLVLVFLVFCAIMGAVLVFCIRERRAVDGLESDVYRSQTEVAEFDARATEREDSRIVIVLFGSIILGALLALITGYLVFFRVW
jgi:hypothetical protein